MWYLIKFLLKTVWLSLFLSMSVLRLVFFIVFLFKLPRSILIPVDIYNEDGNLLKNKDVWDWYFNFTMKYYIIDNSGYDDTFY